MKIKYKSMVLFMYTLFIATKLLTLVENYEVGALYNGVLLLFTVVLIFGDCRIIKYRYKTAIDKNTRKIYAGLIAWLIWSLMCSLCSYYYGDCINYYLYAACFYLDILMFAYYSKKKDLNDITLKISIIVISLFLVWRYITDFNGLEVLGNLTNFFSSLKTERYRVTYGLSHANVAGNICCANILLILIMLFLSKAYKKIYIRFLCSLILILSAVMLLSTGSRTALTSVVLFLLVFCTIYLYRLGGARWKLLFSVSIAVTLIFILWQIDINMILLRSNRLINYTKNIPILLSNSKNIFMGFGLLTSGFFGLGQGNLSLGTSYVDSWYLYILMTTGLVGCALIVLPIISYAYTSIKNSCKAKCMNLNNILFSALILTMLYAGLFETNIIYPGSVSSFIYWVLLLACNQNGDIGK